MVAFEIWRIFRNRHTSSTSIIVSNVQSQLLNNKVNFSLLLRHLFALLAQPPLNSTDLGPFSPFLQGVEADPAAAGLARRQDEDVDHRDGVAGVHQPRGDPQHAAVRQELQQGPQHARDQPEDPSRLQARGEWQRFLPAAKPGSRSLDDENWPILGSGGNDLQMVTKFFWKLGLLTRLQGSCSINP